MELAVTKRDMSKKPGTLRGEGLMPAVVYGRSEENTPVVVDRKIFQKLFKAAGESTVIQLTGLGGSKQALIHEVAFHPLSGDPIHADFYAIEKGQTVTVSVPLEFEGVSPAVKDLGGILTKVIHEVEIEVDPSELPQSITVDISRLATFDDQITIGDLSFPKSAKITLDPEEVVAIISTAKDEPEEPVAMDISQIETSVERGKKDDDEAPTEDAN